jgi:hypothetical protein
LLVVIAFLVKKLMKKRKGSEEDTVDLQQREDQEKGYYAPQEHQTGPVEMLVENTPVEIDNRYVAELPGSHGYQERGAK